MWNPTECCYSLNTGSYARQFPGAFWLLEVCYSTSSSSALSFHCLIQFGISRLIFYMISIRSLLFLKWKKKKKKNPKLFLRQKGHFFLYSCHSKVGSFVFATFNASWLSCSSLWMTPEISAHFPSSWALPCCLSPSLPAASPLHFAVGNTLAAGSSGWGMTAGCRTESDSLPEVLLLFENSWTPFPNLCF